MGSSPLARGGHRVSDARPDTRGLIPARAGRTSRDGLPARPTRAHPRSRGADEVIVASAARSRGSSPLARGGHADAALEGFGDGLIPARAGRTRDRCSTGSAARAHPRSRGADRGIVCGDADEAGSSPLARGGLLRDRGRSLDQGLIPARAGRTSSSAAATAATGAHPRSRGADWRVRGRVPCVKGSSPLARGGPFALTACLIVGGLIPARAGRTTASGTCRRCGRAHPRSRGADYADLEQGSPEWGSSPLARGGRGAARQHPLRRGLIPARAGRTSSTRPRATPSWAHPRSRGADSSYSVRPRITVGSSPLARGGPRPRLRVRARLGLIPARAGRTERRWGVDLVVRAHPRSRGADGLPSMYAGMAQGSSPLARGGLAPVDACHVADGLIPARAGRTW